MLQTCVMEYIWADARGDSRGKEWAEKTWKTFARIYGEERSLEDGVRAAAERAAHGDV